MEKQPKPHQKNHNKAAFESLNILAGRLEDGTFKELLDDWKWILKYSARYKFSIIYYVIVGILGTTMALVSSVAAKYMIDIITSFDASRLWVVVTITVVSSLFGVLFKSITGRVSAKLSIYIHNDIQADIFGQILDADWLALQKYSNGDILNRLNSDMSVVSNNAVSWLPTIIIALYNFAATFIVLWYYDWIMAVIALTSAPVLLLLSRVILKKQRLYSRTVKERSSDLMSFEVETFYGMDTVKSFGLVDRYGTRIRSLQEAYKEASLQFNLFTIGTNAVMSLMGTFVQFLAMGYCLFRLWSHSITFGTMTLFLQQRSNLAAAFNNLLSIIPSFLNSAVSAHRLRELVELPREVHLKEDRLAVEVLEKGLHVDLSGVSFHYDEAQIVLSDVNFHAALGEIVALVGASGEGKTTLLRMILGLIKPDQGKAVIETLDGRSLALNADTRYLFSYVPQGNTIFSGTIAENMRMVKEDASDAEIEEALKIACAWEFVQEKSKGIYANIGERGKGLSEGQAQRIAIARAVLRDAPILLLDEATSALDMATERRVLRNIMIQKPHKTCIVTTHRPSVLGMCQRVYRVSGGVVSCLAAEESEQLVKDF